MTRLILCRHAQAGDDEEAAQLARELAEVPLAALYTSPLTRAMETARAIAALHPIRPEIVPGLREIELGDVAGLQFDEYPVELQQELLMSPGTARFPGGETYEELRERVAAALAEIAGRHPAQTVAAVSHAGAIRAALATWLEIGGDGAFHIDQAFAAVNVIDWGDGRPLVRLVNARRVDR